MRLNKEENTTKSLEKFDAEVYEANVPRGIISE